MTGSERRQCRAGIFQDSCRSCSTRICSWRFDVLGRDEGVFPRWHFKHPNLNDFKRTMQDVSGADLDYYFDEWFGSTRTIDYAASGLCSEKQTDGTYKTTVELRNRDLGVLPVDLTLHYDDGSTGIATVPLAVNQSLAYKKPEAGRLFFPSWDWVSPKYEGSITTPKEVDWYEIDSSYRMMDLNRANNVGMHPSSDYSEAPALGTNQRG